MTKMRYQIKPHIFFLFFLTAFSETWTENLWYSRILGFQKLRLKGGIDWDLGYSLDVEALGAVFIETLDSFAVQSFNETAPKASTSTETPSLNQTTFCLNFETPISVKPQIFCPSFTETVRKKKNVRFPFNTLLKIWTYLQFYKKWSL